MATGYNWFQDLHGCLPICRARFQFIQEGITRVSLHQNKESTGKLAVLSCTHGNLPALTAVFDDLQKRGIKDSVHLGDSVGYGPDPNDTVTFLRERQIRSIQGCWDKSIADQEEDCGCSFTSELEAIRGREVFAWTADRVTSLTRNYLAELPENIRIKAPCGNVLFVHGSPKSPHEYLTESIDPMILLERTYTAKCDVLVCGHTHIPFIHKVSGSVTVEKPEALSTTGGIEQMLITTKFVFNAGSVGEPLNGPEASYLIMDLKTGTGEIVYLPYDVEETIRRMRNANVPPYVIDRFRKNSDITFKNKSCLC